MAHTTVSLDYDNFCARFLVCPSRELGRRRATRNPFASIESAEDIAVSDLREIFINAVNTHKLVRGSIMSCYQHDLDDIHDTKTMVRAAIFRGHCNDVRGPMSSIDQVVPVVFVPPVVGADPFDLDLRGCDDDEDVDDIRARSFRQLSTTAEFLFATQQRVALFTIFVVGRRLRFLRWDRAGLIITPAIDFCEEHATLCDFLWRISHLDDATIGFDLSATRVLPGSAEFLQMDFAARKNSGDIAHNERDMETGDVVGPSVFEYARTSFRESLDANWPRYQLEVPSGSTTRYFLVGKPAFRAESVVGRGTRGYVALDCQTGRFVWLKDVWRMSYITTKREGDVLERLNAAGIEGVPTLVCHGDILEQVTATSYWSRLPSASLPSSTDPLHLRDGPDPSSKSDGRLPQHIHYRIVVEEVCLPLDDFKNGKQLVSIVLDALRTHCRVATDLETRLLHCDISGGNVMIYPKVKSQGDGRASMVWTGILTDWELSKPTEDQQIPPNVTKALRLGTYQFMSVNLLQHLAKPVKISDELESFFHVLLYYAVRHLRSNCDDTASWITNYFDRYAGPEKMHTCGQKSVTIESTGALQILYPSGPLFFHSPIDELFYVALQCFKAHYKVMEHDRQRPSRRPAPPPSAPTAPVVAEKRRFRPRIYPVNEALRAQLLAEQAMYKSLDRGPTAEERELASRVANHRFMIAHLEEYVQDSRWSDDDRIAPPPSSLSTPHKSQPTPNPEPELEPEPEPKATQVGKRRRLAESSSNEDRAAKRQRTSKSKPARKASVPARASTHAMRTRSQARRERATRDG